MRIAKWSWRYMEWQKFPPNWSIPVCLLNVLFLNFSVNQLSTASSLSPSAPSQGGNTAHPLHHLPELLHHILSLLLYLRVRSAWSHYNVSWTASSSRCPTWRWERHSQFESMQQITAYNTLAIGVCSHRCWDEPKPFTALLTRWPKTDNLRRRQTSHERQIALEPNLEHSVSIPWNGEKCGHGSPNVIE